MATPVLNRGTCRYCRKAVIWGILQNGRARSFAPAPVPAASVVERDRFAVSKTYNRVVDLVGVEPPAMVLTPHYCAEYGQRKLHVDRAGDVLGDVLAEMEAPQAPTQRTGDRPYIPTSW